MLIDQFRRITRGERWIPEIDGLRFVAIWSVLLFHIAGELMVRSGRVIPIEPRFQGLIDLVGIGDRGVRLFFTISGMILALPYARHFLRGTKKPSLRKYYLRRVTRLEPPYIAALCLAAGMFVIFHHGVPAGYAGHFFASLFYQHGVVYGEMSPVDMVTWSLEVEIQFYAVAPLFMQLFRIRGKGLRRGLMLAIVAVFGLVQAPYNHAPHIFLSMLFYVQYFVGGLLVADVFVLDLDGMRPSFGWDAAGLLSYFFLALAPHETYWPHAVMPVACGVLMVAALRSLVLRRFFSNRWIATIGGMCYSIYLLHFIFIAALFKVTRHAVLRSAVYPVNLAIQLLVTGVPAVLLCALFFRLVERPCMDPDWPSKLWHWATGRPERELQALDSAGVAD